MGLREILRASGRSLAAVAAAANTSSAALSRWQNGRATPSRDVAAGVAAVLGVELGEIWSKPEAAPKPAPDDLERLWIERRITRRHRNALRRAGYTTVEALLALDPLDALGLAGVGQVGAEDLRRLRADPPAWARLPSPDGRSLEGGVDV